MYALINYVGFVNWLAIGMSIVVLLYFRKVKPAMNRPIKVSIQSNMPKRSPFSYFVIENFV